MIPWCRLGVECQMVNPPRPTGIGVLDDGNHLLALVTYEQAKEVVARYEALAAAYAKRHEGLPERKEGK